METLRTFSINDLKPGKPINKFGAIINSVNASKGAEEEAREGPFGASC